MPERPTFSPFWHRVRAMSARLRPHVQITRQHYRGRRWHVVHDPATNQFYRLNPVAHEFVGLLDGKRTVEEVWKLVLARHGDAAPTQNEVIQLLSQLYQSNLLSTDAGPETEQLLRRGRERFKQKAASQAIGIMYFRIRAFNPDTIFGWLEPIFRPLINVWGLLIWAVFCSIALARLVPEWRELVTGAEEVLNPNNWLVVGGVFIVAKAFHESGHGVICKRFGGVVPEFGFMLLVLFPAPYVDTSSAWAFENKWQRVGVGAGGMIVELFLASIAAIVWTSTAPETLAHQISYFMIFTASVSTVLFNANPLMRFDGYYILSDLIEVPNLMQRSMNQIKHWFKTRVYRMKEETPPSTWGGETAILYVYGIAALIYRIFLFFSITLFVMGKLFALGLILAVWTAGMWFILPVGKFVHWLASSPGLNDFRPRAIATSLAMIVGGLLAVGAIPMPDHRRATGVVESVARTGVFFGTDGFVAEAHVKTGERVEGGQPLVTLRSDELTARLELARATLDELTSRERLAETKSPAAAQVMRDRADAVRGQIEHLRREIERLVVRAPHAGVVVGPDPSRLLGIYAQRGRALCEVVDTDHLRVAAVLGQREAAWLFDVGAGEYSVELRMTSRPGRIFAGSGVSVIEAGQTELPHAAMGLVSGGTIATRRDDRSGLMAEDPQFVMRVASYEPRSGGDAWAGLPGEKVKLRFTLPSKPLLFQWTDRLHKLVQGRVRL